MKIIKVMIAASEEMHNEKVQFSSLIEALNEALDLKGIELERVKWDPENDGSVEDFMEKVRECEMCLTLHWQQLANNAEQELDAAYKELKNGRNPQNLYIFFKEPCPEINEALTQFKEGIVSKYGHFFCKFENVDTMNLQFILQLLKTQNQLQDKQNPIVEIGDGMIKVGNKELVKLDNIPFAAFNKEYQRHKEQLTELDQRLEEAKNRHRANPDDDNLEELYFTLRKEHKDLAEEFDKYQARLYDIALSFAKLDGEHYSERIRKAREEFEKGNVIEADEILNMDEMKREAEQEKQQYEQHLENLRLKVEEFRMKAETVMANTELTVPDRFAKACEAYEQAIDIAKLLHYEEDKLGVLCFNYAYLLADFNRIYEAFTYYQEALEIHRRRLAPTNPEVYKSNLATILNNLAILQVHLNRYNEAEANYKEALEIHRRLAAKNPDVYIPDVATTLNNLAILQVYLNHYDEAETSYKEALEIRRRLAAKNPEVYTPDVAMTLNNLAVLQNVLQRYETAKNYYIEVIDIYNYLVSQNSDKYECELAEILNNWATLLDDLGRHQEAEKHYSKALKIRRRLASKYPEIHEIYVARILYNLAVVNAYMYGFYASIKYFKQALEIYVKLKNINIEDQQRVENIRKVLVDYGTL